MKSPMKPKRKRGVRVQRPVRWLGTARWCGVEHVVRLKRMHANPKLATVEYFNWDADKIMTVTIAANTIRWDCCRTT